MSINATISIEDMPQVVHKLRVELASLLRELAEGELKVVRGKMNEAADLFEAGLRPGDADARG